MSQKKISSGVVHEVAADRKKTLTSDPQALTAWEDITPLARNEWICWIESAQDPGVLSRTLSLSSAFTCCRGVTALHICAEFNSIGCGKVLIEAGADVNAHSRLNADEFGGQTPIFHAVNSIFNYCRPMMELLVSAGASLDLKV
jgi:hypothetical protein